MVILLRLCVVSQDLCAHAVVDRVVNFARAPEPQSRLRTAAISWNISLSLDCPEFKQVKQDL